MEDLKKIILDKDPWQYGCDYSSNGVEYYKCFWCDAVCYEKHSYVGKTFKAKITIELVHSDDCVYKKLMED